MSKPEAKWGTEVARPLAREIKGEIRKPGRHAVGVQVRCVGGAWCFEAHLPGGLTARSGYIYYDSKAAKAAALVLAEALYAVSPDATG